MSLSPLFKADFATIKLYVKFIATEENDMVKNDTSQVTLIKIWYITDHVQRKFLSLTSIYRKIFNQNNQFNQ